MQYIIGNWKMHTTVSESVVLVGKIEEGLEDQYKSSGTLPTVVVCPPFVSLTAVTDVADNRVLKFGAQNVHWEKEGPYTGEIAAPMLKGLVDYVIVGHAERRAVGETNEQVARKVAAVVGAGLTPILCVGEPEANDVATEHCEEELREGLANVDPSSIKKLIVAYEPIWAVGTQSTAEEVHIAEVVGHLRTILDELSATRAHIIYGGGITRKNVEALVAVNGLDGLFVGGASLAHDEFLGIIDTVRKVSK